MKTAQLQTGVIPWAAEKGTETYVPIRYVASGPLHDDHDRIIAWITGFGEQVPAAAAAAHKLASKAGCVAVGITLPFADVVCRANNVVTALERLVMDAPHQVARTVAPDRAVLLGGASRGGGVAAVAAGTGPCAALGILSPLSVTNGASGRRLLARQLELGWRLGVRTTLQQDLREPGNWRTFGGVASELGRMAAGRRLNQALGFALSEDLGTQTRTHISQLHKADTPVGLFAAEQDTCFRWGEYQSLLKAAIGASCCDTVLRAVPGPHSGMESRSGQRQLDLVGQWFGNVPPNTCH